LGAQNPAMTPGQDPQPTDDPTRALDDFAQRLRRAASTGPAPDLSELGDLSGLASRIHPERAAEIPKARGGVLRSGQRWRHDEVSTTGQKTWRYQYRFAGSRRDVKIGRYPEIGVADARARHFELRSLLERGVDPAEVRRQETAERRQQAKDSQPAADQFEAFSRRWIRERLMTRSETYRNQIESRLERFVWPAIGEKPLGGVRPSTPRAWAR
jgi:hypothetical protein